MRKPLLTLALFGVLTTLVLAGCPWSSSPNVFDDAKGISLPSFGGPPPQSEPPLPNDDFPDSSEEFDE